MPNKPRVVGLRCCTKDEITHYIKKYREKGYDVKHLTQDKDGNSLPYNGVLKLK